MNIFLCASKYNYHHVGPIKTALERKGHRVTVPNSYDNPGKEEEVRTKNPEEHRRWKADMLRDQGEKVKANDAILVLNFEKNGQPNYIGGATFLEVFKAFELGKKIFFYNPLPNNNFEDELLGMGPIVLGGDIDQIA